MSNLCTAEGRSDMFGRTCHVDMSAWHGMAPLLGADCGWQLVPQSAGTWDFHHFDPGQDCRNFGEPEDSMGWNLSIVLGTNGSYCWIQPDSRLILMDWLFLLTRTDLPHRPRDAAMLTEHYVEVHYCHLRFLRGVMPSFFLQAFVDLPPCASYAGPGLQDDQWIPVKIKRSIIIMIYLFLLLAWLVLHVEGPQMVITRPKHCCFCNSPWKTSRWFSYIRIPAW